MARRRRRKRLPVIGTAPGQKGRLVIEPSELVVEREPDRVVLHDRGGGTQTRTLEGGEHHIHVHAQAAPGPAPRPEPRMAIDLRQMQHELGARINKDLAQWRLDFSWDEKPKSKSKAGAVWQFVKGGKFYKHPFRALRAVGTLGEGSVWNVIFSSKEAGARNYLRQKRQYKTVITLREKHRLQERLDAASTHFRTIMNNILTKLQRDVNSGRVTSENQREYLQNYEDRLKRVEIRFVKEMNRILGSHMRHEEKSHFTDFRKAGPKARLLPKDLREAA